MFGITKKNIFRLGAGTMLFAIILGPPMLLIVGWVICVISLYRSGITKLGLFLGALGIILFAGNESVGIRSWFEVLACFWGPAIACFIWERLTLRKAEAH